MTPMEPIIDDSSPARYRYLDASAWLGWSQRSSLVSAAFQAILSLSHRSLSLHAGSSSPAILTRRRTFCQGVHDTILCEGVAHGDERGSCGTNPVSIDYQTAPNERITSSPSERRLPACSLIEVDLN